MINYQAKVKKSRFIFFWFFKVYFFFGSSNIRFLTLSREKTNTVSHFLSPKKTAVSLFSINISLAKPLYLQTSTHILKLITCLQRRELTLDNSEVHSKRYLFNWGEANASRTWRIIPAISQTFGGQHADINLFLQYLTQSLKLHCFPLHLNN